MCHKAKVEPQKGADILIPKEIIVKLGLSEGDKLNIFEKDGSICLMPVAVYPKKYLNELKEEINSVKSKLSSGERVDRPGKETAKKQTGTPGKKTNSPISAHQADSRCHRPVRMQCQHGYPHYLVL